MLFAEPGIPALLEHLRDEAIVSIDLIELRESALRFIARLLPLALERSALITALGVQSGNGGNTCFESERGDEFGDEIT